MTRHRLSANAVVASGRGFGVKEGIAAMEALLRGLTRPDAVVAASGYLTLGALLAVREDGTRGPDDLAIVGCNESPGRGSWSRR